MRLLYCDDDGALRLTGYIHDPTSIPSFAILSHTWGADSDEVSLQDVENGTAVHKGAMAKIRFCFDRARIDKIRYVWIDTCCIDKRNSVELSEAINSMFRWYATASICYVYSADVPAHDLGLGDDFDHHWEVDFRRSRWFTRGWTLQELLAPQRVQFYSWQGRQLGTREERARLIQAITGIDIQGLLGSPLQVFSVETRFEWASKRDTRKSEDAIYSLLGIFGVTMLLNYGEGKEKARRRLVKEIEEKGQQEPERRLNVQSRIPVLTSPGENAAHVRQTDHTISENRTDREIAILAHLKFGSMDMRRSNIDNALDDTCIWALSHPTFAAWYGNGPSNVDHHDFLWIKGHPGAGKSTLVKFVDHHISEQAKYGPPEVKGLVLSFYFTVRGDALERSVNGMYRSLIVQLITSVDETGSTPSFSSILAGHNLGQRLLPDVDFFRDPPLSILRDILSLLIQRVGQRRIYCFIDALDETDEDDVVDMVYSMLNLSKKTAFEKRRLLICFASRHYPTLDLPTPLQLVLEREEGHQQDLRTYVENNLHIRNEIRAAPIKQELLTKANGIFLWVVLVVGILNKEYRRGNVSLVEKKLQEIPDKLSELLNDIVQHGSVENIGFILCLRWILFAKTPLTLKQFYIFMLAGLLSGSEFSIRAGERVTFDEMHTFLLNHSKGLAEVTADFNSVLFIHKSVRDFLLDHRGLLDVLQSIGGSVTNSDHEHLKLCCQKVIECRDELERSGPALLEAEYYSTKHIFSHAESAAASGIDQSAFCTWVLKPALKYERTWVSDADGITPDIRPVSMFVIEDRWLSSNAALSHLCPSGPDEHESDLEMYYFAYYAVCGQYWRLLQCLINTVPRAVCFRIQPHRTLLMYSFQVNKGPDAVKVVEILLDAGLSVDAVDSQGKQALHYLAETFSEGSIEDERKRAAGRVLIKGGANIDAQDFGGNTALHHAALKNDDSFARLIIGAGADLNKVNQDGMSPLHIAFERDCQTIWQTLLNAGADANLVDIVETPLLLKALWRARHTSLEELLNHGADVNIRDRYGQSVLHHAVEMGDLVAMRMLLDAGADINIQDRAGNTPLHHACFDLKRADVAMLLLDRGADHRLCNTDRQTALSMLTQARDWQRPLSGWQADRCTAIMDRLVRMRSDNIQHSWRGKLGRTLNTWCEFILGNCRSGSRPSQARVSTIRRGAEE